MKLERTERKNKDEFYLLSADNNERVLVNTKTKDVTLFQGKHFIQTTIDDIYNLNKKLLELEQENYQDIDEVIS